METIVYNAFSFKLKQDSFLSKKQALYALKHLWKLTAGDAIWEGEAEMNFSAVNCHQVETMIALPPGGMKWISLVELLPSGVKPNLDTEILPAICKSNPTNLNSYNGKGEYPLDLVTATFILLTRWEEWMYPVLDELGRHKEDESLCARQCFRDRPLLDEWAKMLRPWLKVKKPRWNSKLDKASIWISHDIDHMQYYKNPQRVIRGFFRDFVHEKSLSRAFSNTVMGLMSLINPKKDPCFQSIFKLMKMDESLGIRATFFFMAAKPSKYDEGYEINLNYCRRLLETIKNQGHDIAWHPSFYAADNYEFYQRELHAIKEISNQKNIGIRHHYLRWNAGVSWELANNNGITFDSSVGYSQNLGFRSSTAHSYKAYDLVNDKPLNLEVVPFMAMDGCMKNPSSMNLQEVLRRTYNVNGKFGMIIHNYTLMTRPTMVNEIYSIIRNCICKQNPL